MELSIRAYARHRGISEGAVRKAIKAGRVTKNANGKIDPVLADQQWQRNSDPAQATLTPASQPAAMREPTQSGPSYQQSRAIREAYNARMAKITYERESGKLMPVDQVKVDAFNAGRLTRDRLLNLPDRVVPLLVGKTDSKAMKTILRAAIVDALQELSGGGKNE